MSSSSSPFKVTVHKTLTLEDRARLLQAKEKLNLLYRLVFSVIVAIPTFIIGIVFMSLVSSQNSTRRLLMEPMWSGNASRLQWSMFFLATPVMFYSAGTFHRRSIKEIYALWRRGSRTPIWKRFLRFGSMNLLVWVSSPGSYSTNESNPGIVWGLGGILLLHRLAGPCSFEFSIPRRSR